MPQPLNHSTIAAREIRVPLAKNYYGYDDTTKFFAGIVLHHKPIPDAWGFPERKCPVKKQAIILACLALGGTLFWLHHDYTSSFRLLSVKLTAIIDDPEKPTGKTLVFATLSHQPKYFFVPESVRRFFYTQPSLCFTTSTGAELQDDYVTTPCFNEESVADRKWQIHEMALNEFKVYFLHDARQIKPTQLFYKTILGQRGMWVNMKLAGYLVPPPAVSQTVFVDFGPYCQTQRETCRRIFGW